MAIDFIKFINTGTGAKISSVSLSNGILNSNVKNFKTETLADTSGLNSSYDGRFPEASNDASTLNTHPGYWYLDRANHSGATTSSSDAATLGTKSGHFYLDRANHSGTMNVSNLVGTLNATLLNGSGGHYFLDRSNHSGTMNASNLVGTINATQLNSQASQFYLDMANFSGNLRTRSVYFSGLSYSVSSGTDYNNSFRSGTYTVNWAQSNLQSITLSGATTLVFSGAMDGSRLQLIVNQDAVGSRVITWPSSTILKWPGATAPTLTTTQSGVDIIAFYVNNGKYYGTSALDFR